jgi:cyclohexyl-isocyanide hydratase
VGVGDRFVVIFPLYPRVTQLDFTGPYEVFTRLPGVRIELASVAGDTLEFDGGMTLCRLARLADVTDCSLICVPGGFGTIEALEDELYLSELRRLSQTAQYVTSVCTGSLLLAAAGLLRNKRAACHWAWRDQLAQFGAVPCDARVVRDGNIITGGGVTAGIDMALTVLADIAGPDLAQTVELALEYAPEPPFHCGRPENARAEIVAAARKRLDSMRAQRDGAAQRAAARLRTQYE